MGSSERWERTLYYIPKFTLFTLTGRVLHLGTRQTGRECGLKYVIHISGGPGQTLDEYPHAEQGNYADMISIS